MKIRSSLLLPQWTNGTAVRLAVTAVVLVAIYAACQAAARRRTTAKVELPKWRIDEIPLSLGPWRGEAVSLDPRLFRATGASADRGITYGNSLGQQVLLDCTIFDKETSGLPHPPKLCYEGNGYHLVAERTVRLRRDDQTTFPASLLTWERKNERLALLFWYQMGNRVLTESNQTAAARWALRGSSSRPALCKFMLQTTLDSPNSAETRLREVAGLLLDWMRAAETGPGPAK